MSAPHNLPLQMQILMLRQQMTLQRQLIRLQTAMPQNTEPFPRSFAMRLLQQQLSSNSPWLMTLKNKFSSKESALLWNVAFSLGQHWLQKKTSPEQ